MSNALWTVGCVSLRNRERWACSIHMAEDDAEDGIGLTPDECDSLAAALVQAAARKRSEDEAKKLETGR